MKNPTGKEMTRREFVAAGTSAGVLASKGFGSLQVISRGVKPVVVAAANANRSKDAAGLTCVAKAFNMMTAGSDVLDACIAGVKIVELEPEDNNGGYGGPPQPEGVAR